MRCLLGKAVSSVRLARELSEDLFLSMTSAVTVKDICETRFGGRREGDDRRSVDRLRGPLEHRFCKRSFHTRHNPHT